MSIKYSKISDYKRGTLYELLKNAYSFDDRYEQSCNSDWKEFDDFFYDNLQIADKYGFFTTLNEEAIGFVSWDPRNIPEFAIIGHNCISSKYKGYGYGKMQLTEAVNRITKNEVKKIIVTTNDDLIPAQHMYESVGFKLFQRRKLQTTSESFVSEHLDYEYLN